MLKFFRKKPTRFQQKQELASPGRYYGDGGTIHGSGTIDIQVDASGHVRRVWFRCQELPWRVSFLNEQGVSLSTGYGSTESYLPFITGMDLSSP